MPRRQRHWTPLPISHDTAARSDDTYEEPDTDVSNHGSDVSYGDFIIFVETFDTLAHPRRFEDYVLDPFTHQAAKICLLKSGETYPDSGRPVIAMCSVGDIPQDAAAPVTGSVTRLPFGPDALRRMLFFKIDTSVFLVVLWCPYDANWAHVATYSTDSSKVRICIRPGHWNQSTVAFLNSHASQFIGLRRIYRIGTGNVKHQDDFAVDPVYTDPFDSAMNTPTTTTFNRASNLAPPSAPRSHAHQEHTEASVEHANVPLDFTHVPPVAPRGMVSYADGSATAMSAYTTSYYNTQYDHDAMAMAYSGAVQWPQGYSTMSDYYNNAAYAPQTPYYSPVQYTQPPSVQRTPENKHDTPDDSPTVTRTVLRNTVVRLTEQAKERNKNPKEYRTVLYDPYRAENKAPLRREAPNYVQSMASGFSPVADTPDDPVKQLSNTLAVMLPPSMPREVTSLSDLSSMSLEHSSPDTDWKALPAQVRVIRPPVAVQYTPQKFGGPFFTADFESPLRTQPRAKQTGKTHDQEVNDWWWSGKTFARQEEYYQSLVAAGKSTDRNQTQGTAASTCKVDLSRLLVPVLENLAAYVEGSPDQRRDYFSRWTRAPEWCCDRSEEGAKSFFDKEWGCPPARIGRDPRYQTAPREPRHGYNRWGHIGSRGGRWAKH